jgi:4-hydroxy-3-polyprenylbenzoate decarboxylase
VVKSLVIGVTGASGAIFGVRLLEVLKDAEIETHLVVSKWGQQTLEHETGTSLAELRDLASHHYAPGDMSAVMSSGSFTVDGMVVAPCSVRSLAAIACGMSENLIHRAADVMLKERRPLVLMVRETPLSAIHLENMLKLARLGATILPPMPAFYNKPHSIDAIVNHTVARMLDQFGLSLDLTKRWGGDMDRVVPIDR